MNQGIAKFKNREQYLLVRRAMALTVKYVDGAKLYQDTFPAKTENQRTRRYIKVKKLSLHDARVLYKAIVTELGSEVGVHMYKHIPWVAYKKGTPYYAVTITLPEHLFE